MADYDDYVVQAKQLANILNGPSNIPDKYLKSLWDISEGGDPSGRTERAINQLMAALERGDVPDGSKEGDGGGDAGGGGGAPAAAPPSPEKKDKKEKKEKKDKKDKKDKKGDEPPASPPPPGIDSNDFHDFVQQAHQLSHLINGPYKIDMGFLKTMWDAAEGGDPAHRVDRAVNQVMARLEKGDVPAATEGEPGSPQKPPKLPEPAETPEAVWPEAAPAAGFAPAGFSDWAAPAQQDWGQQGFNQGVPQSTQLPPPSPNAAGGPSKMEIFEWTPGRGEPAPWSMEPENSESGSERDWWNLPMLDAAGHGASPPAGSCWNPLNACRTPSAMCFS